MLRTTISWTNDSTHLQRILLDIVNVRGGLRADYQLHLHGDGIDSDSYDTLVSYPHWSESILALALRALCQVRWGKQEIPKSRLPSSGICLVDVSVGVSKNGIEPLSELEAVWVYTAWDITTCQNSNVFSSGPARAFTLRPGDSDPFYLAAHAMCQILWDTSTLPLLPEPVHLRVHQYDDIYYVRLSELLLPTSRTAFAIHLHGVIRPAIPGEHSNDCAYLQDWEDFLGSHIRPSKRLKDSCCAKTLRHLPTAAAKDAYTSAPYSQVPPHCL